MNISFAWTTAALLAGRKTVTRRVGSDDYYGRFQAGDVLTAWDRSPMYKGKRIAKIELTAKPYKEAMNLMPDEDYENEGFAYFDENPEIIPKYWLKCFKFHGIKNFQEWFEMMQKSNDQMWVIEFKVLETIQKEQL